MNKTRGHRGLRDETRFFFLRSLVNLGSLFSCSHNSFLSLSSLRMFAYIPDDWVRVVEKEKKWWPTWGDVKHLWKRARFLTMMMKVMTKRRREKRKEMRSCFAKYKYIFCTKRDEWWSTFEGMCSTFESTLLPGICLFPMMKEKDEVEEMTCKE